MSSVFESGSAVAREILERRADAIAQNRFAGQDTALVQSLLVEAFAHGAMWGLERAQHALASTHSRYRAELGEKRSKPV